MTSSSRRPRSVPDRAIDAKELVELWTDGSAYRPYPGPSGMGIIAKVKGVTIFEVGESAGIGTHNTAEYLAAITALRRANKLGARRVFLRTDSKVVVQQFLGNWRCRAETLVPLLPTLRELADGFDEFRIEWIPRRQNREADARAIGSRASRLELNS